MSQYIIITTKGEYVEEWADNTLDLTTIRKNAKHYSCPIRVLAAVDEIRAQTSHIIGAEKI